MLQSFGVAPDGRLVSVDDVARGKGCDCACPECGEVLIARQGDVRAWHFAHASGSDCIGAAEGALHLAAKQVIIGSENIMVPELAVRATHRLDDGRLGEAALARPAESWTLTGLRDEVDVGPYRIDVTGVHDGHPVFIEVAVTHPVDDTKREALVDMGVPFFEIQLDPAEHDAWTCETLRSVVLMNPENRHWIGHPDRAALEEQAQCEAVAKAFEQPVPASAAPDRIRLRLFGMPLHLVDQGWGLCLWWPYDEKVNAMLKAIAKSFGGRYNPRFKNWVIPVTAKAAVLEQLETIGAIREGEANV